MNWKDSAKIVQKLLHDMFEDENGPPLAEQARFFSSICKDCADYAEEIRSLLDGIDGN